MWSRYAKSLLLVVIACACNKAVTAQNMYGCPDANGMNDQLRQILLGIHNEYRTNMVSSQEPNGCGVFPSCGNVYKLQWDCSLEDSAEVRAEQCVAQTGSDPNSPIGELAYHYSGPIGSISKRNLIIEALDFFWNNRDASTNYWKQIGFGQNTKLGCVVHDCAQSGDSYVVCHYEKNAYAKNAEGQEQDMCEAGPACVGHASCTTYPCSFCDTRVRMCFIGTDYAFPCPSNVTTTTTTTTVTPSTPIPCEDITKLIAIDAANNATILTTAINGAFNTWSRSDKSNFNSYKKRIESIIWSTEFPTPDAKMDEILTVITGYAPAGTAQQQLLYSVVIPGFGTIADLVACPRPTTPTTTTTTPTTSTTTAVTTTTTVPPTTTTVGGCPARASLIAIDPASNSTVLTTAINNAFNTWSRADKANFNAYKKRIEDIIYTNTEFPTQETKLQAITDVLKGYAPAGTAQQQLLYAVQIASWGTIADFVACGS